MYDAAQLRDAHQRYLRMRAEPAELDKQAQQADACWTAMILASQGRSQQYADALDAPQEFIGPHPVSIQQIDIAAACYLHTGQMELVVASACLLALCEGLSHSLCANASRMPAACMSFDMLQSM